MNRDVHLVLSNPVENMSIYRRPMYGMLEHPYITKIWKRLSLQPTFTGKDYGLLLIELIFYLIVLLVDSFAGD